MARPDELPESIMLTAWRGLRNNVAKERLGPEDLVTAKNIDLDDAGQPRRRRGYDQKISGDCHSLWTTADDRVLGVKDGVLGLINPDYSFTTVATGAGNQRIAFVQVDHIVYFCSPVASGQIDLNTLNGS